MRDLAALVFVAVLSSGCLVMSLQPAYDDSSIVFDERLVGQWANTEDRTSAAFDRAEWRSYRVTYTDRSATTAFQGNLTKIGVSIYLDLTEPRGTDAGPYLIPTHGVYRIELTGETLAASALDYGWFVRAVAHKTARGLTIAMDPRRNVVLTSSTGELRVWLGRAPDASFGAPMTFTKKHE